MTAHKKWNAIDATFSKCYIRGGIRIPLLPQGNRHDGTFTEFEAAAITGEKLAELILIDQELDKNENLHIILNVILPRNSLKLRCSFGIMELELNWGVLGEVPEASRNAIYEVKREISGEDTKE